MTRKTRFRLLAALTMALSTLLSGCFDYELSLDMRADGASSLLETLTVPKPLAAEADPALLNNVTRPLPTRQRLMEGDKAKLVEKVEISRLDRLTTKRVAFKVERQESGLLEMTDAVNRVTITVLPSSDLVTSRREFPDAPLEPPTPPPPSSDPSQVRARQLWDKSLAGHFASISLRLPGVILQARGFNVGPTRVDPVVGGGEQGQVTWRIPVAALLAANAREVLTMTVDFKGPYRFSETTLRAYGGKHMVVQSKLEPAYRQ